MIRSSHTRPHDVLRDKINDMSYPSRNPLQNGRHDTSTSTNRFTVQKLVPVWGSSSSLSSFISISKPECDHLLKEAVGFRKRFLPIFTTNKHDRSIMNRSLKKLSGGGGGGGASSSLGLVSYRSYRSFSTSTE